MPAGHPQNFLGDSLGLRGGWSLSPLEKSWTFYHRCVMFAESHSVIRHLTISDKQADKLMVTLWGPRRMMQKRYHGNPLEIHGIHEFLDCEEPLTLKLHQNLLWRFWMWSVQFSWFYQLNPIASGSGSSPRRDRWRPRPLVFLGIWRWDGFLFGEHFSRVSTAGRWEVAEDLEHMFRSTWSSWSSAERDAPAPRGIARGIIFGLPSGDAAGAAGKPRDRFWVWIVAKRIWICWCRGMPFRFLFRLASLHSWHWATARLAWEPTLLALLEQLQ